MQTKTTLHPGQKGTKHLQKQYGDRLLAVRYKFDPATGRKYVTVELIEEVTKPQPPVPPPQPTKPDSQRMGVRVDYSEIELREAVKAAGGIWRPRQKLWELPYEDVVALGLESRVVPGDIPQKAL